MRARLVLIRALAPALTLALLGVMHVQAGGKAAGVDVEAHHARARAAIEAVPSRIGAWSGEDVEAPQSAVALLKPNAILGRRYVDASSGRGATLIIVQCRDSRDMSGHYPPVCYPAHGWTTDVPAEPRVIDLGDQLIDVTRYAFRRSEFDRATHIAIYGFFVMPGVGIVQDMDGVRTAASDYRRRHLGAAQVQVLVDATLPDAEQERIAGEILGVLAPVISDLTGPEEGGEPS